MHCSVMMKLSGCWYVGVIFYCSLLYILLPRVSGAANPNITITISATVKSYNWIVYRVEALFEEGDNYTEADRFVWTLPDKTNITPGSNNTELGYLARPPLENVFGGINKYFVLELPGKHRNGTTFIFTASGPGIDVNQPRWTISQSYTILIKEPHRPELYQSYVHADDGSLRLSITLIGGYPEERSVTWSTLHSAAELVPGTSSGPYMALAKTTSEDGVRTYTLVIDSSALTSSYQEFTIVINAGDWVLSYSSSVPATKASLTTPTNSAANLVNMLPPGHQQLLCYVSVVLYVLLSF